MNDAWSCDALISRFLLHPEFKEVYVEGETDVGSYKWFLEETGRDDVLVYPISAVAALGDHLEEFGLGRLDKGSKRSQVILLAFILQKEIPGAARNVSCIADADTQHIQPEDFGSSFLILTDYTGLELYGFRADFITKLIRLGSPNLPLSGDELISQITEPLEKLFSFRVSNHQLSWGMEWISPEKEYSLTDGVLKFNEDEYVKKYLNTKGKLGSKAEFWKAVEGVRRTFGENHKAQIRGHDFIELLTWYLRKRAYRAGQKFSVHFVSHSLLAQLRVEDLSTENLFKTLLDRYPEVVRDQPAAFSQISNQTAHP
jgi:hypothetical protein